MIVIDTNVLSELMRPAPEPSVRRWIVQVGLDNLRITAITRAEILSGIAIMPSGRRQDALALAAERTFANGFDGSVLPFDAEAADHYAEVVATRRRLGRSTSYLDMMIAAIARANKADVATRNVADFDDCGIVLHDPWRDR